MKNFLCHCIKFYAGKIQMLLCKCTQNDIWRLMPPCLLSPIIIYPCYFTPQTTGHVICQKFVGMAEVVKQWACPHRIK